MIGPFESLMPGAINCPFCSIGGGGLSGGAANVLVCTMLLGSLSELSLALLMTVT